MIITYEVRTGFVDFNHQDIKNSLIHIYVVFNNDLFTSTNVFIFLKDIGTLCGFQ